MSDEENSLAETAAENKPESSGEIEPSAKAGSEKSVVDTSDPLQRQGVLSMAGQTMAYIEAAEKNHSLQVRSNDRTSTMLLGLALTAVIIFTCLLGNPNSRGICVVLALASDVFLGLAVLWFVLLRFGVLRYVEPRYALLCWQLMLGAGFLFSFYTMNVALVFLTLFYSKGVGTIAGN